MYSKIICKVYCDIFTINKLKVKMVIVRKRD